MADVKIKKPDGTWVSIKGPKGDPGNAGPAGADGSQGPEGPAGPPGRSVSMFSDATEPASAQEGDIWFEP
jgi:hypothetical protein